MRERRFQYGIDIWVCNSCDTAVVIGKKCPVCGRSYADELRENSAPRAKEYPEHKRKIAPPVREGNFIKSYYREKSENAD